MYFRIVCSREVVGPDSFPYHFQHQCDVSNSELKSKIGSLINTLHLYNGTVLASIHRNSSASIMYCISFDRIHVKLFTMNANLCQYPPFISKMRTSFQKIGLCGSNYIGIPHRTTEADFDSPQKKMFFQFGLSVRQVGVGKLFVWDPAIQTGSIYLQSL